MAPLLGAEIEDPLDDSEITYVDSDDEASELPEITREASEDASLSDLAARATDKELFA